jgi:hypothetical protein
MPSRTSDTLPPFPSDAPVADIYEVDYDKLASGDSTEAQKVFDASRGYGFFYLRNTHINYQYMFDVAQETFSLPLDEKMKYEMGNQGGYFGYKMGGSNYIDDKGTPDNMEFYNVSKDDVMGIGRYKEEPLAHPETIQRRRGELEEFMVACHRVTLVILRVLGEQLGLDSETLPSMHKLEEPSVDQARVTFASPCEADRIAFGEHTGMFKVICEGVVLMILEILALLLYYSTSWVACRSLTPTLTNGNTSNRDPTVSLLCNPNFQQRISNISERNRRNNKPRRRNRQTRRRPPLQRRPPRNGPAGRTSSISAPFRRLFLPTQ